jgi:lantibiotic modifying enzyme
MSLTAAEIEGIVQAVEPNSSKRSLRGRELRELLAMLGDYRFGPRRAHPLIMLCRSGVDHAWRELEKEGNAGLLALLSAKAKESLKRHLQTTLERITRPSFNLEWTSFKLALNALGVADSDATVTERMFLRGRPWDRLSLLFQKFPVLANLWCLAIGQWHDHVVEVLDRVMNDGPALSRFFFNKSSTGTIINVQMGLSDRHNRGRSVTLIEFSKDRRIIYKPRPGKSESAWFALLAMMNRNGFHPKLQIARLLLRQGYYWMEHIEPASCKSAAAVYRFYERMGGLIAAAYLLKAVDCHCQNVIASGEHPVLVDIDALWHVSSLTKTQSPIDMLYRTGFFPNLKRKSLQSRSSVLGQTGTGKYLPRIAGKPVSAGHYTDDIIMGFSRGWNRIIGTPSRRAAFLRLARRVRLQRRRWIYRATEGYIAILQASLQPTVLRSMAARAKFITNSCLGRAQSNGVAATEINAITQLDLPYFVRKTHDSMPADRNAAPPELTQAIRNILNPG